MDSNNYCVIMAGGIGSRFWPMSTSSFPKQFHDILGSGRTLIQQTYDRLSQIAPKENIYVITNQEYIDLTHKQLPELDKNQIIGEPTMMNTAACNIYMAKKIHQKNPNATILVAPADHVILDTETFVKTANMAIGKVENENILVTLGITPTRPDTGYGYIQFIQDGNKPFNKVKTFTEKPNLELAQQFIESGDFLWNAGIFIWSATGILEAFQQFLPEMYQTFEQINSYNNVNEINDINEIYPTLQKISIDNGIMEKADNVYVIPSSFGWSDLGTWTSLYENFNKNEDGNAIVGKFIKTYNSKNNVIRTTSKHKAVIIDGLENYIIVDTDKALLIMPLENDQEIKNYVQDIKLNKGESFI